MTPETYKDYIQAFLLQKDKAAPLPEDLEKRLAVIEQGAKEDDLVDSSKRVGSLTVNWLTTTIRALRAENKLLATRGLIGACDICWTSSWVPVETEAECALAHPHKVDLKDHVRCGHCWLVDHWKNLLAELTKERERVKELESDKIALLDGLKQMGQERDLIEE